MKLDYPGQHGERSHIYAKMNNGIVISIICLHCNFLDSNPVGSYTYHLEA